MGVEGKRTGRGSSGRVLVLFGVALALRLAFMLVWGTPARVEVESLWDFGHEPLCIAAALVDGRGFADQWCQGTGATAWLAPAYPALLVLLIELCGGVNTAMAVVLFVLQSAVSALNCVLLVRLGVELKCARAGWMAGWLLAFYPPAIWNASNQVWDTTLVACAITFFLWRLVRAGHAIERRRAWTLGLGLGALCLLNPVAVGLAPVAAYVLTRELAGVSLRLVRAFELGLAALLLCLPWIIRNQVRVGTPGLRSNLGVELWVGNNFSASGRPVMSIHPCNDAHEMQNYRELGEVAYAAESRRRASSWVLENPRTFAWLSLKRVWLYWGGEIPFWDWRYHEGSRASDDPKSWIRWVVHFLMGLGALAAAPSFARRQSGGWLVLATLALFPAPYFLTHVIERYRFQIEPMLLLLNAWLVVWLLDHLRAWRPKA